MLVSYERRTNDRQGVTRSQSLFIRKTAPSTHLRALSKSLTFNVLSCFHHWWVGGRVDKRGRRAPRTCWEACKRAKRVGGERVDTHKHPFGSDSPKRSCSNKIKQPRLVHAVETEWDALPPRKNNLEFRFKKTILIKKYSTNIWFERFPIVGTFFKKTLQWVCHSLNVTSYV